MAKGKTSPYKKATPGGPLSQLKIKTTECEFLGGGETRSNYVPCLLVSQYVHHKQPLYSL